MGRRKKPENNPEETIIIRPRRIDLEKQIPILRPKDLSSVISLKRRITTSNDRLLNSFETISKDDLKFVKKKKKKFNFFFFFQLNEIDISKPDKVPIPEVKITEIDNETTKEIFDPEFQMTKKYISTKDLNREQSEISLEYDMDEQDEIWLKNYNISRVNELEEVNFERIFALIERETEAKVKIVIRIYLF